MKNNELIERYVYAVVRQLPAKQRADIEQELKSLINDMLEERCGEVTPTDRDVNVVLAELGKPSELAAKYDPDGERSLIGPRYYRRYIHTLKLALPAVAIGLAVAAVLSTLIEGVDKSMNFVVNGIDFSWAAVIGKWIANIVTSLFSAAAIITLVFAIFEYKNVTIDEDDISKLPAVPQKNQQIKKTECIAGIVLSVIFGAVFTLAPQVLCAITTSGDGTVTAIPVFNTAVVRGLWPCWLALIALGIGRDCFGMIEGVYSVRYAIVTAVVNVLSAIGVVFGFCRSDIMNPAFTEQIGGLFKLESDSKFIVGAFEHFNIFLMGVWIFALILNTVEAVVKAVKYKNAGTDN